MNSSNQSEKLNKDSIDDTKEAGNRSPVTIIGLGPMGKAMVSAFLNRGYEVTVWNRTSSKADELVTNGAIRASTISEALAPNELVILSLTDYDAMYAIFESVSEKLTGKVIVNLSSDTPEKAREAAKWLTGRGAWHLTGGVLASPSEIGNGESTTLYSGPSDIFEAHRKALEVLTGTDYKGEDPGLAMLFYQTQIDVFWTSMLSYLHALAVARANGITAEQFLPYVSKILFTMPNLLEFYTPRIDTGMYHGDVEKLAMGLASIKHVVHTSKEAGVDPSLPAAVLDVFERGIASGHADDSFTSLIELFEKSGDRP
ncbi:NAD(P)-binding domain-containing protein [Paenibacillus sp. sptzw28]|uniref:NAD(P)-dependent oxidoreductase n=1 Tax=Paenibacillus sp. sptzw28 TaxID=715179 RepID=UPI001C6F507F|nr:NAD(P)-binding domain-containing protein [Paenibacillus sp. sptzw28]QYR24332.1 NAD(P)-binding domain-containing protein [Paenibacillus sp. sptzw28]